MAELTKPTRRGFLTTLIGIIAAPAIVKYANLMPVVPIAPLDDFLEDPFGGVQYLRGTPGMSYSEMVTATLREPAIGEKLAASVTANNPLVRRIATRTDPLIWPASIKSGPNPVRVRKFVPWVT